MRSHEEIERTLDQMLERNKRVESDKAWETSLMRKFIIIILTYVVIVLFFSYMDLSEPFTNAIVPALAFVLSTLSVSVMKKWWVKKMYRRE